MTTRGLKEKDFEVVGDFLHRSVQLTQALNKQGSFEPAFNVAALSGAHLVDVTV